jgi:hypothetical protein
MNRSTAVCWLEQTSCLVNGAQTIEKPDHDDSNVRLPDRKITWLLLSS